MEYLKSEETEQQLISHFRELEDDGVGVILNDDGVFMYRWDTTYPQDGKVYIDYHITDVSSASPILNLTGGVSTAEIYSGETWVPVTVSTTYQFPEVGDYKMRFTINTTGRMFSLSQAKIITKAAFNTRVNFYNTASGTGSIITDLIIGPDVNGFGEMFAAWGKYNALKNLYIYDLTKYLNDSYLSLCMQDTSVHHIFLNDREIKYLGIPSGVTKINQYAFQRCTSLKGRLTIPNNVTSIGAQAFYGCTGLSGQLTLSNTLTSIGNGAFCNCTGLNGQLTIPTGVTSIPASAFQSTNITSAVLHSGITSIGAQAFYGCLPLTDINITDCTSLSSIGNSAFAGCSGLTYFKFPSSYTTLGAQYIFQNCRNLEEIDFNNITASTNSASLNYYFQNCTSLTKIHFKSVQAYLDTCPYKQLAWQNSSNVNLPLYNAPAASERYFYIDNTECRDLVIPSGTTDIWAGSFANFNRLTSVTIPDSVTAIGANAFNGCSGITGNLVLPSGLTSIGNSAFQNCSGITGTITIPSTVTSIGSYIVESCVNLENVVVMCNVGCGNINSQTIANAPGKNTGMLYVRGDFSVNQYTRMKFLRLIITGNYTQSRTSTAGSLLFNVIKEIRIGGDVNVTNTAIAIGGTANGQRTLEFLEIMGTVNISSTGKVFGVNVPKLDIIIHLGCNGVACAPTDISDYIAQWTSMKVYVGDGSSLAADQAVLALYTADSNWSAYTDKLDCWYNYIGEYKNPIVIPS